MVKQGRQHRLHLAKRIKDGLRDNLAQFTKANIFEMKLREVS